LENLKILRSVVIFMIRSSMVALRALCNSCGKNKKRFSTSKNTLHSFQTPYRQWFEPFALKPLTSSVFQTLL
jgi:hypothetical protein